MLWWQRGWQSSEEDRHTVKTTIKALLSSRVFRPLQRRMRGGATILTYHRVVDSLAIYPRGHPFSGLVVGKQEFAKQLEYLQQNFQVVSLRELVVRLERSEDTSLCVALTFDDGYLDNLTNALPLLELYKTPVTIFVTTGLIDRQAALWWFELEYLLAGNDALYYQIARYATELKRLDPAQQSELLEALRRHHRVAFSYDQLMLKWEQLRELARHPLVTIGAHTCSHAVLATLSQSDLATELNRGRQQLEEQINQKVTLFSYPFGSKNEASTREYDAVTHSGYRAAVTTIAGHCSNIAINSLPRITVDCTDSLIDFAWKLSGFYAARISTN